MHNYKRLAICLVILFASLHVFAQDFQIEPPALITKARPDTSDTHWRGMFVDPYFVVGSAKPSSNAGEYQDGFSMNLGAEICYMLSPNVGISIGANFEQYSYNYTYSTVTPAGNYFYVPTTYKATPTDTTVIAGYIPSIKYTFSYLGIPIMIRLVTSAQHINSVRLYLEAGLSANILLSSNVSGPITAVQYSLSQFPGTNYYTYNGASNTTANVNETNADVSSFTLSINLGGGLIIPVNKNIFLLFEYSPQFGLMNIGTGKNDVVTLNKSPYYFYGTGNYGSLSMEAASLKVIFKL